MKRPIGYFIALGILLLSCSNCASTPPVPVNSDIDEAVINCHTACSNLHSLECKSGQDLRRCEKFCNKVMRSGYMTLPLPCMCKARTKHEATLCGADCS